MSSSTAPPLQLLGLPFSTYTRTITLALSAVEAAFEYTHVPPHDDRLAPHSPLGLLPVLLHGDLTLYESRAVAGYLSAQLPALRSLFPQDAAAAARAERWISLLSSQLFPLAEPRLVKARHALEEEGVSEKEVVKELQPAVDEMHALLEKLEPLVEAEAGPWLVAGQKSWADYFVLPPLADLEATPEVSDPSRTRMACSPWLMLEAGQAPLWRRHARAQPHALAQAHAAAARGGEDVRGHRGAAARGGQDGPEMSSSSKKTGGRASGKRDIIQRVAREEGDMVIHRPAEEA